jgi:hypothetical protein
VGRSAYRRYPGVRRRAEEGRRGEAPRAGEDPGGAGSRTVHRGAGLEGVPGGCVRLLRPVTEDVRGREIEGGVVEGEDGGDTEGAGWVGWAEWGADWVGWFESLGERSRLGGKYWRRRWS